jgi:DNA/RNA-binding domain of Phe-tRNA-synthetase-like protein
MQPVQIEVDSRVIEHFPELAVFALRVWGIDNDRDAEPAKRMLDDALNVVQNGGTDFCPEEIVSSWRSVYGLMGVKPSRFPSSIESLLKRAAKQAVSVLPISAVNIYNAVSLNEGAPVGAYDTEKLPTRDLTLRYASPQVDCFSPLGGIAREFMLSEKLIVYASGTEVMCWGFNCRDSAVASLATSTTDAIFMSEGVASLQMEAASRSMERLRNVYLQLGCSCGEVKRIDMHKRSQTF